jgi:FKBP-type peptidyl-prolyl cis-trans isomerase FklB
MYKLLFLFLFSIVLFSCSNDDDKNSSANDQKDNMLNNFNQEDKYNKTENYSDQEGQKKVRNYQIDPDSKLIKNQIDSLSYYLGIDGAQNIMEGMMQIGLDSINTYAFLDAFGRTILGETDLQLDENGAQDFIQSYINHQYEIKKVQLREEFYYNIEDEEEFFKINKDREEITALENGIQYQVLVQGYGPKPTISDVVKVKYKATVLNDSEVVLPPPGVDANDIHSIPVNTFIEGWKLILQEMPVGSTWKIYIPSELAYGDTPPPGIGIEPFCALVMEISLVAIEN